MTSIASSKLINASTASKGPEGAKTISARQTGAAPVVGITAKECEEDAFTIVERKESKSDEEHVSNKKTWALALTNGRAGQATATKVSLPPKLDATVTIRKTYRFTNASASIANVSVKALMAVPGVVATSATTVALLCSAVRIHTIKVWGPAGGSVSVYWGSGDGFQRDQIWNQDIPTGITTSGCLTFKPAKGDICWLWTNYQAASYTAFYISSNIGAIVDIDLEATMNNAFVPALTYTVASVTTGNLYRPALEGPGGTNYGQLGVAHTV